MASSRSVCPLCRSRRGKRSCPAKGESICAHCCGTKRRVEVRCPEDCVYLEGGQAGSWEGRETERRRDARRLAPFVQGLNDDQARIFFLGLAAVAEMAHRRDGSLDDRLLAEALSAFRKTLDTRTKGILYEHAPTDARAQELVDEFAAAFAPREGPAPADGDLLAAVAALDACAAAALDEGEPGAFVAVARRLAAAMGAAPAPAAQPLILEP